MKYLILTFFSLFTQLSLAISPTLCEGYLAGQDIVRPLATVISKLKLPTQKSPKSRSGVDPTAALLKSLNFFRSNLELLQGGPELFRIFESGDKLNEDQFKSRLAEWAKSNLQGYKLIYLDEVTAYKFSNRYLNQNIPIYDFDQGLLDDKFLFELYADRKIPILNVDDLVSKILILAQPKLRSEFERLVRLYQKAQALGDQTLQDQLQVRTSRSQIYSDSNRLEYISIILGFLLDQIVFLSPDSGGKHKLVLFGSKNLNIFAQNQLTSIPQDLAPAIDLSLVRYAPALSYFEEQCDSNNLAVPDFFSFLVQIRILNRPGSNHLRLPVLAHNTMNQLLSGISLVMVRSNFESRRLNDQGLQAWLRLSSFLNGETELPIQQLLKYGFRFEMIKHYIQIVETDIAKDEGLSRVGPGPLFE